MNKTSFASHALLLSCLAITPSVMAYDIQVNILNNTTKTLSAKGIVTYEQDGQIFNNFIIPEHPETIPPSLNSQAVMIDNERFVSTYEIKHLSIYDTNNTFLTHCLSAPVVNQGNTNFTFIVSMTSHETVSYQCDLTLYPTP